jgi:hypothetical protein
MGLKFTNNATTTLAAGISNSATSLSVQSGAGGLFPALTASDYFYCTLANNSGNVEIVKVTARSSDTFTIVRGYDNTTAMAWNAGDKVELRAVAAGFNDINAAIASVTATANAAAPLNSPALTGTPTAPTPAVADNSTAIATTAFVLANSITQSYANTRYSSSMPNFTASTASALISASLGTGKVDFRNTVLTTGTPVEYNVTSTLTLAMNSTAASLGATTAVATSLIYAIVYNAGSPQLAVCNLTGGLQLDETNLITTTAMGSGSTAANVWYSTSAISTASQYRIVGRVDATWTSGTGWSSPTLVQPVGVGEAMAGLSGFGYGQIWQSVTRTSGTTYYNTTGKPIELWVQYSSDGGSDLSFTIDGVTLGAPASISGQKGSSRITIPPYRAYSFSLSGGTLGSVYELR